MNHPDALKWNGRYAEDGANWLYSKPNALLTTYLHLLPGQGLALDAAAGVGINSLALAGHGLRVAALDISEVALRLARQQAAAHELGVETAVYDLSAPWFPPHSFDVIINFRFLERATFPAYRQALKPGGWLIFETFARVPGQPAEAYYLEPGELAQAFADWQIVWSGTREVVRDGRLHKMTEQLVAQKR
ncbi:MAG: class I SAM-dependent methyltransferase [Anaerolinea sp.]|nr:class I SAM-dependent methyltransferase [Anaerolinea sp.]